MSVVICAVVTIFLARFCFSNFTLRLIVTHIFSKIVNEKGKKEENRVNKMFELIGKVNPKYFTTQ